MPDQRSDAPPLRLELSVFRREPQSPRPDRAERGIRISICRISICRCLSIQDRNTAQNIRKIVRPSPIAVPDCPDCRPRLPVPDCLRFQSGQVVQAVEVAVIGQDGQAMSVGQGRVDGVTGREGRIFFEEVPGLVHVLDFYR